MDFILALPLSHTGKDNLMTVTCKFAKRILLIPGHSEWGAAEWASALLEHLQVGEWGLPKVIISDRDKKFLSALWTSLFKRLGVKLLYSTAYHPQSDGQSEQINQTVEIALRYHLATLDNPADWEGVVGPIQSAVNNSKSSSTARSPNDVVYGFTPTQSTDLLTTQSQPLPPKLVRMEVADAIAFAQMSSKIYYDKKHKTIDLKEGEFALLRLHRGYKIPSSQILGPKLAQQFAGPFKIISKVGNLAYRLEIPTHWRIHPVFTIAQLEPCPDPALDPFARADRPREPDSICVEGDTDITKSYEVERIISHRNTRRRGVEYLVRWKGQGAEYDEWRNEPELGNALQLLEDYRQQHQVENPLVSTRNTDRQPPLNRHTNNNAPKVSPTPSEDGQDPTYRPRTSTRVDASTRITRAATRAVREAM